MANDLTLPRLKPDDLPIVISAGFVLVILALGSIYTVATLGTMPLLSPNYLLTQLQTGAFLGIVAAGMMMVILLGHIDLSVPWTMTAAAMMATTVGGDLAIPTGLAVGLLVGLFNGFGVAYLRIPSMIFTLGVNAVAQGLMVLHTGGFAPQDHATDLMHWLAVRRTFLGIVPNVLFVWLLVGIAMTTPASPHQPAAAVAIMPPTVTIQGIDRSIWPSRITSIAPLAMMPRNDAVCSCCSR